MTWTNSPNKFFFLYTYLSISAIYLENNEGVLGRRKNYLKTSKVLAQNKQKTNVAGAGGWDVKSNEVLKKN